MKPLLEIISKPDNVAILIMIVLVAYHTAIAFAQAIRNDRRPAPATPPPAAQREAKVHVWPYLVRVEFLAAILVSAGLLVWSIVLDAPLEEEAAPSLTPNPAKAPWYFLGLQEMLVYFDPWIAGVVLPTLIILGLVALPYLDTNPRGSGYYTLRERPWAIAVFCFGFFGLWLALIVIGVFLRGPGWLWFWPWEEWDRARVAAQVNVDLPELLGLDSRSGAGMALGGAVVGLYYALGALLPYLLLRRKAAAGLAAFGPVRYAAVSFLLLTMLALPVKMALSLGLNIKYVWVTPWFNV
jgi:hypothetical protein